MSRATYRSRKIVSDSGSDSEGHSQSTKENQHVQSTPQTKSMNDSSHHSTPSSPSPSLPRINFDKYARTHLTPRKTVNFAPTPIKNINFSRVKSSYHPTPARHKHRPMMGIKLFKDNQMVQRENESVSGDEVDGLNLGSLAIHDDVIIDTDAQSGHHIKDDEMTLEVLDDRELSDVDGVLAISPAHSPDKVSESPNPPPLSSPSPSFQIISLSNGVIALSETIEDSDSDSDSDIAWLPTPRRTPGQRRKLVLSDSESDSDSPGPSHRRHINKTIVDLTGDSSDEECFSEDENEDEGEKSGTPSSEGEGDTLIEDDSDVLHEEDDSYGSLKDFIVDDEDEYTHDEDDDEKEEEGEEYELPKTGRGKERRKESNADILHYSPPKRPLLLPSFGNLIIASDSDTDSDLLQPITKTKAKKALVPPTPSKKEWAIQRTSIASGIFDDLDKRVFDDRLGAKNGVGAGAKIIWNNRLLTTAGVARSKRVRKPDGSSSKEYWIELSEKVLTGKEQILNTVAHEMCHLAAWIIDNEYRNPHGKIFKSWGRKVMRVRKDIEVTTTHRYVVEFKYKWQCTNESCRAIYKRHSKSIDITKQACGSCRGKLRPTFETKSTASSPYQLYLKANMANAKSAMPKASHGEVMRALSKRWTEVDSTIPTLDVVGEHERYWKSLADVVRSRS